MAVKLILQAIEDVKKEKKKWTKDYIREVLELQHRDTGDTSRAISTTSPEHSREVDVDDVPSSSFAFSSPSLMMNSSTISILPDTRVDTSLFSSALSKQRNLIIASFHRRLGYVLTKIVVYNVASIIWLFEFISLNLYHRSLYRTLHKLGEAEVEIRLYISTMEDCVQDEKNCLMKDDIVRIRDLSNAYSLLASILDERGRSVDASEADNRALKLMATVPETF